MKTRIYLPIVVSAIVFLLAGCKFQAMTRVEANGSGELRTEVGFRAEERQNMENQSGNEASGDFCNTAGAPEGVVATEEQRGDETWCVTVMPFDDLDELRGFYEQKKGLRVNRLEIADGTFYYDVDIDTSSETSDFSVFESVTWSLSMPGVPAYHNAHRSEGNTLTWDLSPDAGMINLRAEGPAQDAAGPVSFLLGIAALLGLAALIGFSLWRLLASRRKGS